MNMMAIDEETVICEQAEVDTHQFMEKLGFNVIKVPFQDVFEFGGYKFFKKFWLFYYN